LRLSASDVAARLGPSIVLAQIGDLSPVVNDIQVTDPAFPTDPASGSLIVATGYRAGTDEFARLAKTAHAAGASGIVLKDDSRTAERPHGPGLIVVDRDADWSRVLALLRVAIMPQDVDAHPQDSLFGLADAIASLCGGPIVIHDPAWQLLAYSGGPPMDSVRNETILGRRAPEAALAGLREKGVLAALERGDVVQVKDDDIEGLSHRFAVAARWDRGTRNDLAATRGRDGR